ncbi:MAG: PLDc N-terminal domain-containing protein [Desulfobacterales bacterium]|nr:PLDc N-terminal domain-containing protein [Desulfobacterales bacterium]
MTENDIVLYILIIAGVSFGLTMLALVDLIKKDFPTTKEKFLWHLVAIIPVIGWLIYFLIGAKKGIKKSFGS